MTKAEIITFIETMKEFDDFWTEEQVEDVYRNMSLENAIADRKSSNTKFAEIVRKILN